MSENATQEDIMATIRLSTTRNTLLLTNLKQTVLTVTTTFTFTTLQYYDIYNSLVFANHVMRKGRCRRFHNISIMK